MTKENLQLETGPLLSVLREAPVHLFIYLADCISITNLEFAEFLVFKSESFFKVRNMFF